MLDAGTTTVVDHAHLNYSPDHCMSTYHIENPVLISLKLRLLSLLQSLQESDLSSVTVLPQS
jgi:hypothetical protein